MLNEPQKGNCSARSCVCKTVWLETGARSQELGDGVPLQVILHHFEAVRLTVVSSQKSLQEEHSPKCEKKKTNCIPDADTVSWQKKPGAKCHLPRYPVERSPPTTRNQEWRAKSAALTSVSQEERAKVQEPKSKNVE